MNDVLPKYLTRWVGEEVGGWRRRQELGKTKVGCCVVTGGGGVYYIHRGAYTSFPIKTKCCFAIRGAPLGVWKWRITRAISAEGG